MNWADDEVSDDEKEPIREQMEKMSMNEGRQQPGRGEPLNSRGEVHGHGGNRPSQGNSGDGRGGRPDRREGRGPVEIPETAPFVAYVGNLSYNTTLDNLGNYFHSNGCDVDDVNIADGRGFGHITFANRESLEMAMGANGTTLDGRQIRVDVDRKRQDNNRGSRGGVDSGRGGGRGDRRDGRNGMDDRRNNISDREEVEADSWGRGTRSAAPPRREGRDGGRGGDRSEGKSRGGRVDDRRGDKMGEREPREDSKPKSRPVINIAPRTIPVEEAGAPATASSIFGDAKPRDERAFLTAEKADKKPREKREKHKDGQQREGREGGNNSKTGGDKVKEWTRKKQHSGDKKTTEGDAHGNGNKSQASKSSKAVEKVDDKTYEEKFQGAQKAIQTSMTSASTTKVKPPANVFAAAFAESDSD